MCVHLHRQTQIRTWNLKVIEKMKRPSRVDHLRGHTFFFNIFIVFRVLFNYYDFNMSYINLLTPKI